MYIGVFVLFTTKTSWNTLFADRNNSNIIHLSKLYLVSEVPLSDYTLNKILNSEYIESKIEIQVYNYWEDRFWSDKNKKEMYDQALLKQPNLKNNFEGKRFALYLDIPREKIKHLENPTLFYHKARSNWDLYINNNKVKNGTFLESYILQDLPKGKTLRVTWVLHNWLKDRLIGISFLHGISVRSYSEANWASRNLPSQFELPRLIAAIFFACFAITALVMAISSGYKDFWALACFCSLMFIMIWKETPYFWESFKFVNGRSDLFLYVKSLIRTLIFVVTFFLNLCFFRIDGDNKKYFYIGCFLLAIVIFYSGVPQVNVKPHIISSKSGEVLTSLMFLSNLLLVGYGFYNLISQKNAFAMRGLRARVKNMNRRIFESILMVSALFIMLQSFWFSLPIQSTSVKSDIFFLTSIIPASVLLIQFFWILGNSNRRMGKIKPNLNYLEELLIEYSDDAIFQPLCTLGEKKRVEYCCSMFHIDLRGFKGVDDLRNVSSSVDIELMEFYNTIEVDIKTLFHSLFTRFTFKPNGDELIYLYYAKDENEAKNQIVEIFKIWKEESGLLLNKWLKSLIKTWTKNEIGNFKPLGNFNIHVAICSLNDVTIKRINSSHKADFDSKKMTALTELHKNSLHNKISTFSKDAKYLKTRFSDIEIDPQTHNKKMSYVSFD